MTNDSGNLLNEGEKTELAVLTVLTELTELSVEAARQLAEHEGVLDLEKIERDNAEDLARLIEENTRYNLEKVGK